MAQYNPSNVQRGSIIQQGYVPQYGAQPTAQGYYDPSADIASYPIQNYNPNYDAGGPRTVRPDLTTEDPMQMAVGNRGSIYDTGNRLDADYAGEIANRYQQENRYRQPMDAAYSGLAQVPGYTPEEQQAILRQDELSRLGLTQDQANSFQFTPDEFNNIAGNPSKQYGWYNPGVTSGIADQTDFRVNDLLNNWGNASVGAYNGMAGNTRGAISSAQLEPSSDYTGTQDRYLSSGASGIRGAFSNPNLGVSSEYRQNMQFGPQAQQEMEQAAANTIGNSTRALRDQVEMKANASGYNSPMALASGYQQLQQQGDSNAADAALAARVQAKRLGLDVTQGREDTRLGAAQTQAGMALQGENQIMNSGLDAAGQRENFRSNAAQTRLGSTLQNEQGLGGALMGLYSQHGQAGMDANMQLGAQRQAANQYNQNTGIDIERNVDKAGSDRAALLAQNRQNTAMYGQDAMFGQGFQTNNAASTRNANIANARIGGGQEYRNWATGQTNEQANLGQQARTGRTSAFGTAAGAANSAANTASGYKTGNPSFGRTFAQGLASGTARALTGGFGG